MSVIFLFILQARAATLFVGPTQAFTNIQSAVSAAQPGDTIEVEAGTYTEAIQLGTKELSIIGLSGSANTIIQSPSGQPSFMMSGQSNTTIEGFTVQPTAARGFQLMSASPVLVDLVVEGANTTGQGGGLFVSGGAPILSNVLFQNNSANSGGDIYATNGASVSVADSSFVNSVAVYGASIYIGAAASINVLSSSFSGVSGTYGGVLYALSGFANFDSVDIVDSFAIYDGAGFYLQSSSLNVIDTQMSNSETTQGHGVGAYLSNSSTLSWDGGGIDGAMSVNTGYDGGAFSVLSSSSLNLSDIHIQNSQAYRGGGVFVSASSLTAADTVFEGNSATVAGGAVCGVDGANIILTNATLTANTALGGGAVDIRSFADLDVVDSTFQYNQASNEQGGAIRAEDNGQIAVFGSQFSINGAYLDGGAIYIDDLLDDVQITDSEFISNESDAGDGGALSIVNDTKMTIQGSTFIGNSAGDHGGAISYLPAFFQSEGLTLLESTFISNASLRGGAVSIDEAGYAWVLDSYFEDNLALYLDGGALRISAVEDTELTRNILALNTSNQDGGGVWLNASNLTESLIQNNIWIENEADSGAALAISNSSETVHVSNNTFAGNSANQSGAHLHLNNASISFVNNLAMQGQDGSGLYAFDALSVAQSDFYYNALFSNTGGDSGGFMPNIQNQTGNMVAEPLVYSYSVDGVIDNDNVHLQLISPLRDMGDPSLFDVDGTRSDIGAYGGLNAAAYDNDGDGFFDITDCDDSLNTVYPNAPEIPYDGIDQDCLNGDLVDVDGDGFSADIIGGADCDDAQDSIFPGATDTWYDGIDSNCDLQSDYDADADGHDWNVYGGNDCDDSNASIGPSMQELWYDGADQNCDGLSDYDADQDGQDAEGYGGSDCDEGDATIYLGAPEVPYDGIDQNCDGDDLIDVDYDGWIGIEAGGADCNDSNALVFPGATEVWYDGIDQDCAGDDDFDADGDGSQAVEFGGTDCDDSDPSIYLGATEVWYDGIDQDCAGDDDFDADGDGQVSLEYSGDDCDDTNPDIYLGATEVWYDGVDQDCLGGDDYDADGDGYSFDINPSDSSDCDDTDHTVYPGAEELLDGLDNDCDGYLETDDQDNDGLMDWHEWVIGSDPGNPDSDQDSRLDGKEVSQIGDELLPFDTDGDGLLDIFDTDDDDDGIPTFDELNFDVDGDGEPDWDVDGDDILNHRDKDSDGDGLSDLFEGLQDSDLDGIPDYLDYAGNLKGSGCQVLVRTPESIGMVLFILGLLGLRRREQP